MAVLAFYVAGHASVASFLTASLLGNLVFVQVAIARVSRQIGFGPFSLQTAVALIRNCIPFHLAVIISLVTQRLDQIGISFYLPIADFGFYVVAFSIAGIVGLSGTTLAMLSYPKISGETSRALKATLFARFFKLSIALSILIMGFVYALSPLFITFLFGTAYLPSIELSRILLIGAVPAATVGILWTGFRAYGVGAPVLFAYGANLIVTTMALFVLVPKYGVVGAVWSVVIAQFLFSFFLIYSVRRTLRIGLRTLLIPANADWAILRTYIDRIAKVLL